jgi:hypothetical protein
MDPAERTAQVVTRLRLRSWSENLAVDRNGVAIARRGVMTRLAAAGDCARRVLTLASHRCEDPYGDTVPIGLHREGEVVNATVDTASTTCRVIFHDYLSSPMTLGGATDALVGLENLLQLVTLAASPHLLRTDLPSQELDVRRGWIGRSYRVIHLSYSSPLEVVLGIPYAPWAASAVVALTALPRNVRRFSRLMVSVAEDSLRRDLIRQVREAIRADPLDPSDIALLTQVLGEDRERKAADGLVSIQRAIFERGDQVDDSETAEPS